MAKAKPTRRSPHSYTVNHINKTIRPGDCVLMRPPDSSKQSYVARVENFETDSRGANVRVHVRWYYRPEESIGGRRQFHGSKEVFLSDHFDIQSADTIEGKCIVHSFKSYTKLDAVGTRISSVVSSIIRLLVLSIQTELPCIANVRCLIIQMTLWFNVKDAVIGFIQIA